MGIGWAELDFVRLEPGMSKNLKPKLFLWSVIDLLFRPESDLVRSLYGLLVYLKAYFVFTFLNK